MIYDDCTTANTADRCNNCQKIVGKANLKKCSKCGLVFYCSKECQRNSWPIHKPACTAGDDVRRQCETNPNIASEIKDLTKWLAFWRGTLFEFAILAMDLANHPEDRLATHIVFMEFDYQKKPRDRSRMLSFYNGFALERAVFVKLMRLMNISDENIEAWKADSRGPNVLQVNIVIDGHVRTLFLGLRDLSRWRKDKEQSRIEAGAWKPRLREKLISGQPGVSEFVGF